MFALASSSLVAYLLSRRLVGRLERLGRAAEALQASNLSSRVPVEGQDEVAPARHHTQTELAEQGGAERLTDSLAAWTGRLWRAPPILVDAGIGA